MDTGEILSQVAAYTQKFVDAAIPVAKQAYEIGLLTIRIDALQVLILAFVLSALFSILIWKFYTKVRPNISSSDRTPLTVCAFLVYTCVMIWPILQVLNIWLWVQLLKPELWLAKQAITAVLNATGAK